MHVVFAYNFKNSVKWNIQQSVSAWCGLPLLGVRMKQAQICAEGCEEDNITHSICIKCQYKSCTRKLT